MEKILLVDDEVDLELLAKQKFRKQIAAGVFELLFAKNGLDALELVQSDRSIAVVVLDLNMPGMDGLTLLDKLKDFNPAIQTIVVSAYSDTKTFRVAMNKGAFDFVTKPVDFQDLGDVMIRSLTLYRSFVTSLSCYQEVLKRLFPDGFELAYLRQEKLLLWDAFLFNPSHVVIMGISVPLFPLPSEVALGAVHGTLKAILRENPSLSLTEIEDKIYKITPSLKAAILIGQYRKDTHEFVYQTNGEFTVQHRHPGGEFPLPAFQTALLNWGDAIAMGHPLSSSRLAFERRAD